MQTNIDDAINQPMPTFLVIGYRMAQTAKNLYTDLPQVKLIAILRQRDCGILSPFCAAAKAGVVLDLSLSVCKRYVFNPIYLYHF